MSKLAQIHTYPPSLAKSKIMVKTFSLYHTGPVTCNSYFRHFESRLTVKKKNHYNGILFPERNKSGSKRPILFCLLYQGLSGVSFFPTIPDYFESFLKATENVRSLQVEEKSKNLPLYFPCEEYIFYCRECVDKIFFRFSENILHALNSISFGNSKH